VPRRERQPYTDLCREYSRLDVPWASDEEAVVRWILDREPDYFSHRLPFIGYVQFLYEVSLQGGERIAQLKLELGYGTGGMHQPPKEPGADADRHGPWRFKAVDRPNPESKE
jgi:hypothetical protein